MFGERLRNLNKYSLNIHFKPGLQSAKKVFSIKKPKMTLNNLNNYTLKTTIVNEEVLIWIARKPEDTEWYTLMPVLRKHS